MSMVETRRRRINGRIPASIVQKRNKTRTGHYNRFGQRHLGPLRGADKVSLSFPTAICRYGWFICVIYLAIYFIVSYLTLATCNFITSLNYDCSFSSIFSYFIILDTIFVFFNQPAQTWYLHKLLLGLNAVSFSDWWLYNVFRAWRWRGRRGNCGGSLRNSQWFRYKPNQTC